MRTTAEGAEGQSVIPRSWSFGRVGSQLECVVSVGLESLDDGGQAGSVSGKVV